MSVQLIDSLKWGVYEFGINPKYDPRHGGTGKEGTECWEVRNLKTDRGVLCSSEEAALKIIELAQALRDGKPKPHNERRLEGKAAWIEKKKWRADLWTPKIKIDVVKSANTLSL